MQLQKSTTATPFCKLCGKKIDDASAFALCFGKKDICTPCFSSFYPKMVLWKEGNVPCYALYEYKGAVRSAIYQFKGCGDIELGAIFLERFAPFLKFLFRGFRVMIVPSTKGRNEERGFNQVEVLAKSLGLPSFIPIEKIGEEKQSNLGAAQRGKIKDSLRWIGPKNLRGVRVLILDDIYTTGSTIRSCLELVQSKKPEKIAVLVVAKTKKKRANSR